MFRKLTTTIDSALRRNLTNVVYRRSVERALHAALRTTDYVLDEYFKALGKLGAITYSGEKCSARKFIALDIKALQSVLNSSSRIEIVIRHDKRHNLIVWEMESFTASSRSRVMHMQAEYAAETSLRQSFRGAYLHRTPTGRQRARSLFVSIVM